MEAGKHAHESHTNAGEHSGHAGHEHGKAAMWLIPVAAIFGLIAGVLIAGVLFPAKAPVSVPSANASVLSLQEASQKAVLLLNRNFLAQQNLSATLTGASEQSGFYLITVSVSQGGRAQTISAFITKDGEMLFNQAINLTEKVSLSPQQQQPAQNGDWSFEATDPSIGPRDANVTVIEFADFQCPYCGIAYGKSLGGSQYDSIRGTATKITNEYAKTGKIRFVYHIMDFLGQESVDAANAALCARETGGDDAFFKMHDKLFDEQNGENKGTFSKANLKRFAAEAGFNSTGMAGCIDSGRYDSQVEQSNAQAAAVGVQSTPTFAVNRKAASPEYARLKAAIDSLLKQ